MAFDHLNFQKFVFDAELIYSLFGEPRERCLKCSPPAFPPPPPKSSHTAGSPATDHATDVEVEVLRAKILEATVHKAELVRAGGAVEKQKRQRLQPPPGRCCIQLRIQALNPLPSTVAIFL